MEIQREVTQVIFDGRLSGEVVLVLASVLALYLCTDNSFLLRRHYGTSAIMNTYLVVMATYCGCLGQSGHEKGNQNVSIIKSTAFTHRHLTDRKSMKFP